VLLDTNDVGTIDSRDFPKQRQEQQEHLDSKNIRPNTKKSNNKAKAIPVACTELIKITKDQAVA
jgi:hypothetical protein